VLCVFTFQDTGTLTPYDGVRSELKELVFEFLAEPFHILLLCLFRALEALCVSW
jgi:hypothetical protein